MISPESDPTGTALHDALHALAVDAPAADAGLCARVAGRVARRRRRSRAVAAGLVVIAVGLMVAAITAGRPNHATSAISGPAAVCPNTPDDPTTGPLREGTAHVLVPNQPVSALACWYYGPPEVNRNDLSAVQLKGSGLFIGGALASLITSLNGTAPINANVGPRTLIPVPSLLELRFWYASGPGVIVVLTPADGSGKATNGSLAISAFSGLVPGFTQNPTLSVVPSH